MHGLNTTAYTHGHVLMCFTRCFLKIEFIAIEPKYLSYMPLNSLRSSFSLSSTSLAHSFASVSSCWTSGTEWGPGALTAKVLVAVGATTLRTVEHLILRKKLRMYRSRFPHMDEASFPEVTMAEMYSDILEMSRYYNNISATIATLNLSFQTGLLHRQHSFPCS